MQATAQREEQVSSAPIDLNPPVRAESIDLRVLVSHRTATPASASVESVAEIFKSGTTNFVAVLDGQRLLGMVWFDRHQTQDVHHQDWRLEGKPAAMAAFIKATSDYHLAVPGAAGN